MLTLITLFFVISPLVILYTAGYRYDFSRARVASTGVISIEAQPRDASVFLNGVWLRRQLPIRLKNRAPGTYTVRIEKQGYFPYEKTVTVRSNETTYIKDIVLVKDNLPIKFDEPEHVRDRALFATPASDRALYTYGDDKGYHVSLLDTRGFVSERRLVSFDLSDPPSGISVSPFHDTGLIGSMNNDFYVYDIFSLENPNVTHRFSIPKDRDIQMQWSKRTGEAYVKTAGQIRRIDRNGSERVIASDAHVIWYVEFPETLWVVENGMIRLSAFPEISYPAPIGLQSIVDINRHRIIAQTENGITVIHRNTPAGEGRAALPAREIIYFAPRAAWFAWSDHELWRIDEFAAVDLIERHGSVIQQIAGLDRFGMLLLMNPDGLTVFNPGQFPAQSLYSTGDIASAHVVYQNRKIFLIGTIGNKEGLYMLEY